MLLTEKRWRCYRKYKWTESVILFVVHTEIQETFNKVSDFCLPIFQNQVVSVLYKYDDVYKFSFKFVTEDIKEIIVIQWNW